MHRVSSFAVGPEFFPHEKNSNMFFNAWWNRIKGEGLTAARLYASSELSTLLFWRLAAGFLALLGWSVGSICFPCVFRERETLEKVEIQALVGLEFLPFFSTASLM